MMSSEVIVELTPENGGMSCHFLQSVDDEIDKNLEVVTFSLFSDDDDPRPGITEVDPNRGQISVLDNDGKFHLQ